MGSYLARRLILIPLTLLVILLVNFIIINMAPGDPSTISSPASADGSQDAQEGKEFDKDDKYLVFREHYGLTRPILFNGWAKTSPRWVLEGLGTLATRHRPGDAEEMKTRNYNEFRVAFADRSRFMLPQLLDIAEDQSQSYEVRQMALRYLVRGATRMGYVGSRITKEERAENRKISSDNHYLRGLVVRDREASPEALSQLDANVASFKEWLSENRVAFPIGLTGLQRWKTGLFDTRLSRYMGRVVTLDFGTMRNDANRTVISEVVKRLKYSLTLAVFPMLIAFLLCQVFGFLMALKQNRWPDYVLNLAFLVLYAAPVFVVAPFLIEKVALHHDLPISGFSSSDRVFGQMDSWHRLLDISLHLFLPLLAVMYGTLAVQSRLSRTAVLEVFRQDYVRTARAKGVPTFTILWKHVGRNAAITVLTSLVASLGVVLGGALIIETIFGIDGFGRFFYLAIINRDFNVILFSTIAGACLTLIGYLVADIAYTFLDPRVTLD